MKVAELQQDKREHNQSLPEREEQANVGLGRHLVATWPNYSFCSVSQSQEHGPGSSVPGSVEAQCSLSFPFSFFFSFLGSPLCGSFNSDVVLHLRRDRDAGK